MLGCIQPMSSPMMKRMLGFCCCCAFAAVMAMNDESRPRKSFLVELMACFLSSGCPNWAGSWRPVTITKVRRDGMDATVASSDSEALHALDGWRIHTDCSSFFPADAGSAHVSCTEDAIPAPKTLWWSNHRSVIGPFEITVHYRSFDSDHALHVCEIGQSTRDAANAAPRRKCCHPPVTSVNIRACCRDRKSTRLNSSHV